MPYCFLRKELPKRRTVMPPPPMYRCDPRSPSREQPEGPPDQPTAFAAATATMYCVDDLCFRPSVCCCHDCKRSADDVPEGDKMYFTITTPRSAWPGFYSNEHFSCCIMRDRSRSPLHSCSRSCHNRSRSPRHSRSRSRSRSPRHNCNRSRSRSPSPIFSPKSPQTSTFN